MSRRVLGLVAAGLLVVIGPVGCSSGGSGEVSATSGATASAAPTSGAELEAAAFAAALKRPGTTILDVRTPAEFASGHLPGAVNLDLQSADFLARLGALPKDMPYAVYCRSGNRSAQALAAMSAQGFTQAFHLGGGIQAWTAAGGDLTPN